MELTGSSSTTTCHAPPSAVSVCVSVCGRVLAARAGVTLAKEKANPAPPRNCGAGRARVFWRGSRLTDANVHEAPRRAAAGHVAHADALAAVAERGALDFLRGQAAAVDDASAVGVAGCPSRQITGDLHGVG